MKFKFFTIFLSLLLSSFLHCEELKIKADYFESDQKRGISVFRGHVNVKKGYDEINATKLSVYTDEKRDPKKFVAEGDVTFKMEDEEGKKYVGKAQKVVYLPKKGEYRFYNDVHLKQIGERKEIQGDEVVFDAVKGTSHAKGINDNPVIMIFDINETKK